MKRIPLIFLGSLVLIIAALILTKQPAMSKDKDAGLGKKAAEFTLTDINGARKSLSDFKGKVIILDFWATWCPPCRQEIPHFISLYDQYKGQGLEIIGIALDNGGAGVVSAFSGRNKINYTVLLGNDEVSDLYGGIAAIPTTFILDKDGNIRKKYIGYNEKEVFERDIKELL
jgi:cytochrome c biogenesis protein CcmG/thiol:disulfide interchange protein DsbE